MAMYNSLLERRNFGVMAAEKKVGRAGVGGQRAMLPHDTLSGGAQSQSSPRLRYDARRDPSDLAGPLVPSARQRPRADTHLCPVGLE
ncbi:hypothetical protein GCM10025795_39870 [Verticiella sediminum]